MYHLLTDLLSSLVCLQLSVPHNIKVSIICPGFIDSPMTRNMRSYGSIMPDAAFANASGLAGRTARAVRNNEGTVLWPRNQVRFLRSTFSGAAQSASD